MKKILMILLVSIFLIGLASASLGTYQQFDCVQIKTILNSSWVNISSLSFPNSSVGLSNVAMTKSAQTFTYNFCSTDLLGVYVYDYYDDKGDVYVNDFNVTQNGRADTDFPLELVFLFAGIIMIGASYLNRRLRIFKILGALLVSTIGVLTIYPGYMGLNYTNLFGLTIGIISIGIGAYFLIEDLFYVTEGKEPNYGEYEEGDYD